MSRVNIQNNGAEIISASSRDERSRSAIVLVFSRVASFLVAELFGFEATRMTQYRDTETRNGHAPANIFAPILEVFHRASSSVLRSRFLVSISSIELYRRECQCQYHDGATGNRILHREAETERKQRERERERERGRGEGEGQERERENADDTL